MSEARDRVVGEVLSGMKFPFTFSGCFFLCVTGRYTESSLYTPSTICDISQTEKGFSYHFQLFTITLVFCFACLYQKGSFYRKKEARDTWKYYLVFSMRRQIFFFFGLYVDVRWEGFSCHFSFLPIWQTW